MNTPLTIAKQKMRWQTGRSVALGALLSVGTMACAVGEEVDGFSAEEVAMIKELQPLNAPMPRNPFNHKDQDVAVAKLGQMLFPETDYSEAITVDGPAGMKGQVGKVGCITCHDPAHNYVDTRPTSHGRTQGRRNSPTMVNVGWYEWAGWSGRFDSLVMHGAGVMGSAGTPLYIAHYLYTKYRDEYNAAFPETPLDPALDKAAPDAARFPATGGPKANAMAPDGPWEMMAPADRKIIQQIQYNMGRVWDTYPRMLVNRNSPFERYVRDGEHSALSPAAKNGLKLFIGKAACNDCHVGPLLSDNGRHNVGVPDAPGATAQDMGHYADLSTQAVKNSVFSGAGIFSDDPEAGLRKQALLQMDPTVMETMKGAFRTPMLINIAQTGPYFHTGLFNTLEEVVRHYNAGGGEPGTFAGTKDPRLKPLNLTEKEISDLVEFLKTLTGDPPDEEWTRNISKPRLPGI